MSSIIRGSDNFDSVYQVSELEVIDLIVEKGIPSGLISMWSGTIESIPLGWFLCDGTNGTPDLRDRFVVGAGSSYGVGVTGGSKDAIVVAHTHTQVAHNHTSYTNSAGAHSHGIPLSGPTGLDTTLDPSSLENRRTNGYFNVSTSAAYSYTVTVANATPTINSTGESGVNKNLPPYYALAYIMKT